MATNNKRLNVADLDFDNIKTNLKAFLKSQSEFADYDFEGSAMSVLIDLLAYNTHYNGVYTNLSVNEMFLDSASKRASVVSLAKMLGYVPRSSTTSVATVNATVSSPTSTPSVVTLPALQPFNTTIDGKHYTFYNIADTTVALSGGSYTFSGLKLYEGTPLEFRYTVATGVRYIIPNANVDLNTVTVQVQENSTTDEYKVYNRAENLVDAASDSRIYFVKEIDDGLYELSFGDDILGVKLTPGNVVTINYFVTNETAANGARFFSYGGVPIAGGNLSVVTVDAATGGGAKEDIDSIKFNAPRYYAAQNRAVTPDDYKALILKYFPEAGSVQVWGGENNDPPVYGKTFICVKPKDANKLTNLQKETINNSILQKRNIVSITPEIVDPEYFNIKFTTTVHYNDRETTKTPEELKSIIKDTIMDYDATELQKFEGILRFSKLTRLIDECDPSIINNTSRIMVRRQFAPKYNISAEYKLNLINPISQDGGKQGLVFSTTGFYIPNLNQVCYLDDDSNGIVRLFYNGPNSTKVYVNDNIGTIDYAAGRVLVQNLTIVALEGPIFEMQVKPESYDVVSALNQVVQISEDLLQITVVADQTANGDMQAGYNYVFTSIRS